MATGHARAYRTSVAKRLVHMATKRSSVARPISPMVFLHDKGGRSVRDRPTTHERPRCLDALVSPGVGLEQPARARAAAHSCIELFDNWLSSPPRECNNFGGTQSGMPRAAGVKTGEERHVPVALSRDALHCRPAPRPGCCSWPGNRERPALSRSLGNGSNTRHQRHIPREADPSRQPRPCRRDPCQAGLRLCANHARALGPSCTITGLGSLRNGRGSR